MNIFDLLNTIENEDYKDRTRYPKTDPNDISKYVVDFPLYVDIDGEGFCVRVKGVEFDYSNETVVLQLDL